MKHLDIDPEDSKQRLMVTKEHGIDCSTAYSSTDGRVMYGDAYSRLFHENTIRASRQPEAKEHISH